MISKAIDYSVSGVTGMTSASATRTFQKCHGSEHVMLTHLRGIM